MNDDTHRKWDIIFKWIGLFPLLLVAVWTVHKYNQDRQDQFNIEQTRLKENHDSFIFEHQAQLYFDATKSAATLAVSKDPKALAQARVRFEQLFWGDLVTVEDRRVELAMIAFRNCLQSSGNNCARPPAKQHGEELDSATLNKSSPANLPNLSLDLGACTRSSLREGWKIQFGQVEPALTKCPYD